MNPIQIQGLAFSLIAILFALSSLFLGAIDPYFSLLLVASSIFFLGVPHGALDPIFAQKLLGIGGWKAWSQFVFVYLALAITVIGIWWQFPLFFMASFLILSMMHFSRDLSISTPKITRLLYGGSMIVLPTLFHFTQMQQLFALILGVSGGLELAGFLHFIAWPWAALTIVAIGFESRLRWRTALEISAVCSLATLAQPLIAFTVYFCAMHSLRHILRTKQYAQMRFAQLFFVALAPMLGVALMAILAWIYLPQTANVERILRFVFVALAALTVPHMILIDRVHYQN
ncbi:beta-carotene 15,15'-monooxygenase, Brp/Blh family [Polynucleobacter meluiroseus]|uniref:Probable beta-carotene 15,15'-dioxygenase n=1 Tax=Polynucleobacter meluiroseus TaxID=1938814 RepID=A0A240DZ11_9BURK|nr:Brp/Blh family beta-carotene 15,15'-dioxygenase [Polynucleobacter meluiroseus]SNX27914.1 beta-carotene 15,15'-monooxygenase, Brp/Blh family [Polynucleobacter meluiroseus]